MVKGDAFESCDYAIVFLGVEGEYTMNRKKASFAVVLLVVFMYVVAEILNDKEIIFPEIAALGVGAWFIKNSPWGEKPIYLWISPTFAALTGVGMLHFLPYPKEILIGGVFIAVVLQLCLLRSKVLPSISAAILPIVINADSVYYILSVCMLSGIIAVGRGLLNHFQSNGPVASNPKEEHQNWGNISTHWLKLFIGVIVVATIACRFDWIFIIAPPLIVTFVEFANPNGKVRKKPGHLFGLILFAAFSGTLAVELHHTQLYWPLWVFAGCITIWIFFLYKQFEIAFPPAAAISLLPTIIPQEKLLFYPFEVTIGVLIFIIIGKIINFKRAAKEIEGIHAIR